MINSLPSRLIVPGRKVKDMKASALNEFMLPDNPLGLFLLILILLLAVLL